MSINLVNLVNRARLDDIPTTKWAACKNVLRCLADHANESEGDLSWPGVELLMLETGCSESVIQRTTDVLAKHGWLNKRRRAGTSNLYRLNRSKLQRHQVDAPRPASVFMSEHLAGMEFAEEATDNPTKPVETGRSTSRERDRQRRAQRTRQIDGSDTSNRRERHVKSTVPSRQIDALTISEPSGNHQPTNQGADGSDDAPDSEAGPDVVGWSEAPQEEEQTTNGTDSDGARLLRGIGISERAVHQWADTVEAAIDRWGPRSTRDVLTGGDKPGPGAIISTRLPNLAAALNAPDQLPGEQVVVPSAAEQLPEKCDSCDERRFVETAEGLPIQCPTCNPRSKRYRETHGLDSVEEQAHDAATAIGLSV